MQKIIIADLSRLLREMLTRAINRHEHLKIVKTLNTYDQLIEQVEKQEADWVIVSFSNSRNDLPEKVKDTLFEKHPELGVLEVSPDASHVRVNRFEMHERVLDGISLDELIKLLSNGDSIKE